MAYGRACLRGGSDVAHERAGMYRRGHFLFTVMGRIARRGENEIKAYTPPQP